MNKGIILSLAALIVVGIIVSRVKYEVIFLKNKLKDINSRIEKYSDDLKVYNAEWGYLNNPKRLKTLCEKYLKHLHPTVNRQILDYQTILNSDLVQNRNNAFEDYIDEAMQNLGRR